jgi:hypothetical protein
MLFSRRARGRLQSTEARMRAESAQRNRTQAAHLRREAEKIGDADVRGGLLALADLAERRAERYDG